MFEKFFMSAELKKAIKEISESGPSLSLQEAIDVINAAGDETRMYESLHRATMYAAVKEPDDKLYNFLHKKQMQRLKLTNKLIDAHIKSGGKILPGVGIENESEVASAINEMAERNPDKSIGIHPLLDKIIELEKFKYLVGRKNSGTVH